MQLGIKGGKIAMKLERFRKFNTRDVYPGGAHDNDMCMTVRAGNRIFLRGQTGLDRKSVV